MTRGLCAVAVLALAACGNDEHLPPDSRLVDATNGGIDSAVADAPIDATPADAPIDAIPPPDAMPSSVIVEAGPCQGIQDHTLTNNGTSFVFDGMQSTPPITIAVGENIEYTSQLGHNFANATGPNPPHGFRSGPTGQAHTACLTFTQAFTGDYLCEVHLFMTNTLTVQ